MTQDPNNKEIPAYKAARRTHESDQEKISMYNTLLRDFDIFDGSAHSRILRYNPETSFHPSSKIDAIFVPTRVQDDRIHNIIQLASLSAEILNCPTYLVTTTDINLASCTTLNIARYEEFLIRSHSISNSIHRPRFLESAEWDLGLKRTFICLYSQNNSIGRILMIDDDVIIAEEHLLLAASALTKVPVAASRLIDHPDHSIVGHAARSINLKRPPFLSGAFLALNVENLNEFFPNIYNEDWFFFFKILDSSKIYRLPDARQIPTDPFKRSDDAAKQEFGDLLAEGFLELVLRGRTQLACTKSFWSHKRTVRKVYIKYLMSHIKSHCILEALMKSIWALDKITAEDCVEFISSWRHRK